jgi:hypothetical protein
MALYCVLYPLAELLSRMARSDYPWKPFLPKSGSTLDLPDC